ncbi:hypothetical protein D9619_010903 [Psilocybe cf. subviscida]|uniref:Uncharacterized protein n=1 Tax=Psilocybe cf. subviscida TaxID=2480587 RepID=A0A8H5B8A4_9AGAR|nr:hypothetical protein D9619_010903 [Psilocybe cf. subviscida]
MASAGTTGNVHAIATVKYVNSDACSVPTGRENARRAKQGSQRTPPTRHSATLLQLSVQTEGYVSTAVSQTTCCCTGGTSNDRIVCALGSFTSNGTCVTANTDGVCTGTNLIIDNNERECDSCGAKCFKCKIPNFGVASTVDQKQCNQRLPGFFFNNGVYRAKLVSPRTVNRAPTSCPPDHGEQVARPAVVADPAMALGCALIILTLVWCCCRRRQKRCAQNNGDIYRQPRRTGWRWRLVYWVRGLFHQNPRAHQPHNAPPVYYNTAAANSRSNAKHSTSEYPADWRATLMRWDEKLFGHGSPKAATLRPTDIVLLRRISSHDDLDDGKLRTVEEARNVHTQPSQRGTEVDVVNLIDSYNKDPPQVRNYYYPQEERRECFPVAGRPNEFLYHDSFGDDARRLSDLNNHSAGSLYSQATGVPHKVEEPRLPLWGELSSRFPST